MMMLFFLLILFVGLHAKLSTDWFVIPTPPYFTDTAIDSHIYYTLESTITNNRDQLHEHTLRCAAAGYPPPTYKWKKDGVPFNLTMHSDRITQLSNEGSFVFRHFIDSDAGKYQCEATNDNGTAVGDEIIMQRTWMKYFPSQDHPEIVRVEVGDAYSHNCTPPQSMPTARVYWIWKGDKQGAFDSINESHISVNEQGTIFFHHVKLTDNKLNQYYTCTAENTKLKDYKFGNQFQLNVTTNKRRNLIPMPPTEQYVNQSAPIALKGHTHKLYCFFSGVPEPTPKWYKNGELISEDKDIGFTFESYGKTLVLNVTMDKAGQYECRFPHHADLDRAFNVLVEAAPYWFDGPPTNKNASEGENVIFHCQANGKPIPTISFYKNGVEMTQPKSNENWIIKRDKLTLYSVKKGPNGTGDNAVYQCKVQNLHGYIWTNFYLNLLDFQPTLPTSNVVTVLKHNLPIGCQFFDSPIQLLLIIVILAIIIFLPIILCICCILVQYHGAKYPVFEKERRQGREPLIGNVERGFSEYN